VTISGLRLSEGNDPDEPGGAIRSVGADLTVSDSVISGNRAFHGGGIYSRLGSLEVRSSTVSGNRALQSGAGGIGSAQNYGGTEIVNSTISGNSALGFFGGVYIGATSGVVEGTLQNVTIADNAAFSGGGLGAVNGSIDLSGALIADNTATSEGRDLFDPNVSSIFSGEFNLVENPDGESISGQGNILGVDPKLKPLKNNGGPTDTHAFKKRPAKNKLPKGQTPKSDQRGAKRVGKGDIGAYELVKCKGVIVNRVGTAKKDKLKGTNKKDGILGLGGNDKLAGKKGKDGLCGGKGKDKLKGGPGKDKLDGGPGKDKEVQ
jgi:hypothetical protein